MDDSQKLYAMMSNSQKLYAMKCTSDLRSGKAWCPFTGGWVSYEQVSVYVSIDPRPGSGGHSMRWNCVGEVFFQINCYPEE